MLRAGPLSSPEVMETLERDYVNAWVLDNDLVRIAGETADPRLRALAEIAHENYLYPVDSQIYSPAGELLDHLCANVIISGEGEAAYRRLLKAPWTTERVSQSLKGRSKVTWRRGERESGGGDEPKPPPR